MKRFEHVGMMWVSALTAAVFALLLCFAYLNYRGGGGGGEGGGGARARLWMGVGIELESKATRSDGDGYGVGDGGARVCDVFQGRWELDEERYPPYESRDFPFSDEGFRCSENGRPDRFYTK